MSKSKKKTWGGARNVKDYTSTVVRVPDPVLPKVQKIIDDFKAKQKPPSN